MAWSRRFCTAWATRWPTVRRCWPSKPPRKEVDMRILLHRADGDTGPWVKDFSKFLPEAEVAVWRADENKRPCDYAVVWSPPEEMLAELNDVKAAFITGAGVDGLLK